MKCVACSKEVDLSQNQLPPVWYAKYLASAPIAVICSDCLKTPEGQAHWNK